METSLTSRASQEILRQVIHGSLDTELILDSFIPYLCYEVTTSNKNLNWLIYYKTNEVKD